MKKLTNPSNRYECSSGSLLFCARLRRPALFIYKNLYHSTQNAIWVKIRGAYRIVSYRNERYDTIRYARPTIRYDTTRYDTKPRHAFPKAKGSTFKTRYDTIRLDANTIRNDTRYDTIRYAQKWERCVSYRNVSRTPGFYYGSRTLA